MNYFRNLTSANSGESSKRFQSLGAFFMLIIIIIAALFGIIIPDTYIYALVSIALGTGAMTLVQNNSKSEGTPPTPTYPTYTPSTQNYDKTGNYNPPEKDPLV